MYDVIASDGIKLRVEDLNSQKKNVIVLVHGWPLAKEMYEYQKDVLINLGYRLVSFDLRGFGDSETASDGYCYDQLAEDVKSVIDHLNVPEVTLVGFSMGGAICVRYMGKYQNEKVKKLILIGAAAPSFAKTSHNPYGSERESINSLIKQGYLDRPQMVTDFGNKVFALAHSNPFLDWFTSLGFKASGIGTIQTAVSLREEDVYQDLSEIKVPTLILHGKQDQICPYGFALIMNQKIPNSKLIPFEYSGHGVFYDELGKFNQEIVRFLNDYE